MELIKKGKLVSKIIFSKSVEDLINEQSTIAIRAILSKVDSVVLDNATKKLIRKEVLDNVNDMCRVFKQIVEQLVK